MVVSRSNEYGNVVISVPMLPSLILYCTLLRLLPPACAVKFTIPATFAPSLGVVILTDSGVGGGGGVPCKIREKLSVAR